MITIAVGMMGTITIGMIGNTTIETTGTIDTNEFLIYSGIGCLFRSTWAPMIPTTGCLRRSRRIVSTSCLRSIINRNFKVFILMKTRWAIRSVLYTIRLQSSCPQKKHPPMSLRDYGGQVAHRASLKSLYFQDIPSLYGEDFFDIPEGNQLHFILGVIFDPRKDNRPF